MTYGQYCIKELISKFCVFVEYAHTSLVPRPSHKKWREGLGDGPIHACRGGICST